MVADEYGLQVEGQLDSAGPVGRKDINVGTETSKGRGYPIMLYCYIMRWCALVVMIDYSINICMLVDRFWRVLCF